MPRLRSAESASTEGKSGETVSELPKSSGSEAAGGSCEL